MSERIVDLLMRADLKFMISVTKIYIENILCNSFCDKIQEKRSEILYFIKKITFCVIISRNIVYKCVKL